jgi:PAS domain S-box-containing protein
VTEKAHILLLEDNLGDAKLVEILLSESSLDYELTRVDRLGDGLRIAQKHRFDIALLDLGLPDSHREETLSRAIAGFPETISIIVLTGDDSTETIGLDAIKAGAQDYLVKGEITAITLVRSVMHAIQRRRMFNQLEHSARDLRASEKRLIQAQRLANIGNYEFDIESQKMYWSEQIFRILEYDINHTTPSLEKLLALASSQDRTSLSVQLEHLINGLAVEDFSVEYKIQLPDGKTKYLRQQGQLDFDEYNGMPKVVGTIQDITTSKIQRDKLKQSEERYRTIFEQSQDCIFICTTTGKLVEFNQSLVKLLDRNAEDLGAITFKDVFVDQEQYDILTTSITEQIAIKDFEVQLADRHGNILDCLITATQWLSIDGEVKGYNGIIHDITPFKRTQDLIKAKEIAERSASIKEQFLANMSHEIRTPMNVVIGMTHLLETTDLDSKQKEYLDNLKISSETLLKLINNILDFSKMESGKLELEQQPFNLAELLQEVVQTYKYNARDKGISLFTQIDIDLPKMVIGDSTRLLQVLNNLVSNAIKYTHHGEVTIRCQVLEENPKNVKVHFAVKDTGIGIPSEKQQYIFESFAQASTNTTRLYGGTGLGLSIAKKLVELFGGQLSLHSQVGIGSTFSFEIVFKTTHEQDVSTSATNSNTSTPVLNTENVWVYTAEDIPKDDPNLTQPIDQAIRILLVEDHLLNQSVVKGILQRWSPKIQLQVADNGQIAIEKLLQDPHYDLILMDISMPIMDGYQASQHIRTQLPEPIRSIPIIAMTAHAFNTNAAKCFEVGMNEFISKPINPTVMFAKINKILRQFGKLDSQTDANASVTLSHEQGNSSHNANTKHITDLTYLEELSGGDAQIKISMLETILSGLPEELERVSSMYEAQNWQELRAAAHKMKSTCAYMGLDATVDVARNIEYSSNERKNLHLIGDWVRDLQKTCTAAAQELEAELNILRTTA